MVHAVDIVVLSRSATELPPDVERGLQNQQPVNLVVHRVIGTPRPDDRSRCDAIARARNVGKHCGDSPWLMFLDDDVVLESGCLAALVDELERRPDYAAMGADYLGELRFGRMARHVSMGATLFRRQALDQINFAWRGEGCECQSCCDDLRKLQWKIDYSRVARARHLVHGATNRLANGRQVTAARITCMCVTHARADLLQKAIDSYQNQTYADRELVVVYHRADKPTQQLLEQTADDSIVPVDVPRGKRLRLGELRNIARQAGTGDFVAQWDDDDWSDPFRLERQMQTIRDSGRQGCVLARQILFDYPARRAYCTFARTWENTILVKRSVLPPYPNLHKLEDTPVVEHLMHDGRLAMLDAPELYVYTYHGRNTWDRRHWNEIVRLSRPLGAAVSRRIGEVLDAAGGAESRASGTSADRPEWATIRLFDLNCGRVPGGTSGYARTAGALQQAHTARASLKK